MYTNDFLVHVPFGGNEASLARRVPRTLGSPFIGSCTRSIPEGGAYQDN